MIRFDRVDKRYPGGIEALTQVSFEIARGELVVLTGPSGAADLSTDDDDTDFTSMAEATITNRNDRS